jgi:hypothetical protein
MGGLHPLGSRAAKSGHSISRSLPLEAALLATVSSSSRLVCSTLAIDMQASWRVCGIDESPFCSKLKCALGRRGYCWTMRRHCRRLRVLVD